MERQTQRERETERDSETDTEKGIYEEKEWGWGKADRKEWQSKTDRQNEGERREHVFRGNRAVRFSENFQLFQVFSGSRFWGRRRLDKRKHRMKGVGYFSHVDFSSPLGCSLLSA